MAAQNNGADKVILGGGTMGDVTLPHHTHQKAEVAGDCKACHDTFPQEAGVIARLKAEDKLKSKEVMNKICLNCHRAKKTEGAKSGPTSCKECHNK
jgi:hypothetical protein